MSNIIEMLAEDPACTVLRKANLHEFLADNPKALLFFTGNVAERREGLDVAVVVRELLGSYGGELRLGLVDRRDESTLMSEFGVVVTPAVVYVRDGQAAEVVARMRDWPVFAQACDRLLASPDAGQAKANGENA
jgi:hydrogenase-1 operon protein HyaE